MKKNKQMTSIKDVLDKYKKQDKDKYISREFQKYGYDLAVEMDEPKRAALYIKLAKNTDRGILENARSFIKDANNVKSKGRLFLWKVKQLKDVKEKKK